MIEITKEHYNGYVYDITVEKNSNFFANGICVHNCAKKKYALKVYNSEGVLYPEGDYKIMGIEVVRSSTPAMARDALKKCVISVIDKDIEGLRKHINNTHEQFKVVPVEEIAFPRGANNLSAYSSPETLYTKGCPIAVRGAILYNHYIHKFGLEDRYDLINEGDKIKFLYIKEPNKFKENIIGFLNILPPEFGLDSYVDRELQFEKVFMKPIEGILDAVSWELFPTSNLDEFF